MRSPHPSTYTNTVLNFLPAHTHTNTHRPNHTKGKRRFLQPRTKPIKKLKDKYTHTLAKSYKHYKLAVAHTHTHSYSQKSSLLNTGHKSSQHTKVLRKFVQQIFSFKLPFLRFLHSSGLLCNCFYLFFVCFGFCFSLCNTFQCAFTVFASGSQCMQVIRSFYSFSQILPQLFQFILRIIWDCNFILYDIKIFRILSTCDFFYSLTRQYSTQWETLLFSNLNNFKLIILKLYFFYLPALPIALSTCEVGTLIDKLP